MPTTAGGSGDTSIMTGLGIYMGMKACAKEAWGSDSLEGKTVAMQGFGKVATHTAHHLMKEDATLIVTDVFDGALDRARDLGLQVVKPDEIYGIIERLVGSNSKKLELFARNWNVSSARRYQNWVCIGNQIQKTVIMDDEISKKFDREYPEFAPAAMKSKE